MALRHITLLSAALGAAFMFSSSAQACTLDAWTVNGVITGTPVAGGPAEAPPNNTVRRYSGLCGMRATGAGNFVQNNDPAGDQIFRQRFYVYTSLGGGTAVVYQAGNGTNANEIEVSMTGGTQISVSHRGGAAMNFATTANRWYSVETALNSTATATTGDDPIPANTLVARVGGGGSDTVNPNSASITSGAAIDFARLGCVSGCGASNVDFEEYESTRSAGTAIGRLCRGDTNADNTRNILDAIAVFSNINNNFTGGQPDVNEDGAVNILDAIALFEIINSPNPACP
jgi:hypothetical protein